jgi:hypothetical protein
LRTALRGIAILLVASVALGACGGAKATEKHTIQQLPGNLLPAEVNGLEVRQEEITSTIKEQNRSYVDAVGLYSFRKKDLLQSTLQVSKFSKDAKYTTRKFKQAIIGQIGTTVPKQARMGDRTVYVTTGKKQSVVIWFTGPYVMVLSSREDFTGARNLLRTLLDVKL